MSFKEDVLAAKNQSHWTAKQRNHMRRMQKASAVFAYYLTDSHGRPSNHKFNNILDARKWTVKPGIIQRVDGPLVECSENALHATLEPHKWVGNRVWVVAFLGEVKYLDTKIAGLHREIIGEVMPEEALSPSVGVKLGRKDLGGADLPSANLISADLRYANLSSADLSYANLRYANLISADLSYADLRYADLRYADLRSADLRSADLRYADLRSADLSYADLRYADLRSADLRDANLSYADLRDANLRYADLRDANLSYCAWNDNFPIPNGWKYSSGANRLERG